MEQIGCYKYRYQSTKVNKGFIIAIMTILSDYLNSKQVI